MAHIDLAHVRYDLPDGRPLLSDVSFRLASGTKTALIGPNGTGKTTLLRIMGGDLRAVGGSLSRTGTLAVMPQAIGKLEQPASVRELLASVAPDRVHRAAAALRAAEALRDLRSDEQSHLAFAQALADWGDAGGYQAEAVWDKVCQAALGLALDEVTERDVRTLSGGEQKRLVLEALLRGEADILLLDEPDNFLDVPAKRWLEGRIQESAKTILLVSHDRELLSQTAERIVTLESGRAWVHGDRFVTYSQARSARLDRLEELNRRWLEERDRLRSMVRRLGEQARISPDMASRYRAAQTRLRKFEEMGPPESPPSDQKVQMRLRGGRTGVKALSCVELELVGLVGPFSLEVFYGERLAVLGSNGSGKSRFLELLAQQGPAGSPGSSQDTLPRSRGPVPHQGRCRLGARVVPGYFAQSYELSAADDNSLVEILFRKCSLQRGPAVSSLARYELELQADQTPATLSGGQLARFQILLLEQSGVTLLLLDEPTGNLDLVSAQALEDGLRAYHGTVISVTHDRWFARSFDRFLVFDEDGVVREVQEPIWETGRAPRPS
ncbi:MAG TPA: ATP-binding cassette domain-containing protein [Candidatus Nanopelagicaceae bacterium]|nr:ATP-binding cassette domain-containing protein [Candidatus Nanopelagicaceae bacterium]